MDFVPDTYGECRDSERPEASKLSAWLIETAMRGREERQTPEMPGASRVLLRKAD